jgi:nucleotide-binding universal stress UspA family protein
LLAFSQRANPRLFPGRSQLLAAVLAGDLHVLEVLPPLQRRALAGERLTAERVRLAEREAHAWYHSVLRTKPAPEQVHARIGDFVPEVVARAAALDAALIVLPQSDHRLGTLAVELALEALRPVLVARPLAARNTLLAALDLDDEHHPVLEAAEVLASELDVPVIALHNADPDASLPGAPRKHRFHTARGYGLPGARGPGSVEASQGTTMLLTREDDAAFAIVREARVHDVDTILVGARPPSWLDRRLGQDVVARVVDHAEQSVLIMPLASPEGGSDFVETSNGLH